MLNTRISKLALAGAMLAVVLTAAQETRAGGFSIRIGGLGIGSWSGGCADRTYIYYTNYDDDWGTYEYRRVHRRPVYRVQPYYRPSRRFHRMHHRRRPHRGHGGSRRFGRCRR